MEQNPQVSATISRDLHKSIVRLAEDENRSVSSMVALLLQYAIREKTRRRSKKDSQV